MAVVVYQRRAGVAVDVRHHQVHLPLREAVEALALEYDAPDVLVVALDVRLVGGGVGAGVEHARAPRAVPGRRLDGEGVGEFRAVVREDGGEQHAERGVPERAPHPVECVGDVLRALPRHEPCEHEALPREHDRQQDVLVAPAALHRVGLRDLHARVLGEEVLEGAPRASFRAVAVHLVLDGRAPALLVPDGHREVVALDGEDAPVDVVVYRVPADAERVRRGEHRVVDALSPVEGGHEDLVDGSELALGGVDALPGLHERPAVPLVRELVQVVELAQAAPRLVRASVADVRRGGEAGAALLLEARARALPAAQSAAGAPAGAVRAPAHPQGLASAAVDARVEPATVERLGRLHAAVHDLALDRRAGNPRLAPDLRERLAPAQGDFQRKALVVRQVLVLLLLDCHVGILSSLRRGGIAASAERMPCFARKRKWASGPARLSGQVSTSPLPTYLCNRHSVAAVAASF